MRRPIWSLLAIAFVVVGFCGCSGHKDIVVSEAEILDESIPPSTDIEYVAVYRDVEAPFPRGIKDRNRAKKEAIRLAVLELKMKGFLEAADEVRFSLAQGMNDEEYDRAVKKANKDFQTFINDWKIIKQEVPRKRAVVILTVYFKIDKAKLREALMTGRAIINRAKYKTYVELYWNVPGRDISPEICNTLIENVENYFARAGYNVVQFERIKGKLVRMLKDLGENTDDLYSQDELKRFKANLELRNIDSRFVNGKQILGDYADLLIGVTINNVEVTPDMMLSVRITVNATLFERNDWVSLASRNASGMVPYDGGAESFFRVAERVALNVCEALEPGVADGIARREAIYRAQVTAARDFTLVFKGISSNEFRQINNRLMGSDLLAHKGSDAQARKVYVQYRGTKDALAGVVESVLRGAGFSFGPPEYSADDNTIVFRKQ
ncbi:hypothetical protein J7M28_12440 [bacterium]|nr:hypothetical protein [bacterium]